MIKNPKGQPQGIALVYECAGAWERECVTSVNKRMRQRGFIYYAIGRGGLNKNIFQKKKPVR
jgi:hypothetical protein